MKKNIRNTYVYKILNLENTVEKCAKINANLQGTAIANETIDAILNEMKFKISVPMKAKIIEDIKNGKIVLVDSPEAASLQTWMISDGSGGIKHAVVNIFGKIRTGKDGLDHFSIREVFALCVLGVTVRGFYEKEAKILNNLTITKYAAAIYERMFYRVLDTLYAIDVGGSQMTATIKLLIRIFFVNFLLEKKFDIATNEKDSYIDYILSHYAPMNIPSDPQSYFKAEDGNPLESLPSFIDYLRRSHSIFKDLDATQFLRKFLMMYGEKALLMIENYQYFLGYVMTVTVSGNVVKDFALEPVIGKEGIPLYNAYFDLLK